MSNTSTTKITPFTYTSTEVIHVFATGEQIHISDRKVIDGAAPADFERFVGHGIVTLRDEESGQSLEQPIAFSIRGDTLGDAIYNYHEALEAGRLEATEMFHARMKAMRAQIAQQQQKSPLILPR